LQQGRLFYAAAAESPLEIKPLQLFYGMLGFAKALVLGRSLHGLETLPQTHGIRDVSAGNARISDLRVKIEGDGTFQRFNDVCAPLTRIPYFEGTSTPAIRYVPSMKAVNLHGLELSLKDILGRIPTLDDLSEKHSMNCRAVNISSSKTITTGGHWRSSIGNSSEIENHLAS